MTLEIGPAPLAASTPAANDTSPAKSKPNGGHETGGTAKGGFMAILAALGTATAAGALDPTQPDVTADPKGKSVHGTGKSVPPHAETGLPAIGKVTDGGKTADAKTVSDAEAAKVLAAGLADSVTPTAVGTADMAAPVMPADATALLAQSAQWSATTAATPVPVTETAKSSVAGGVMGDGLAAAKLAYPLAKPQEPMVATAAGEASVSTAARSVKSQKDAATRLAGANTELAAQASATAQPDPRTIQMAPKVSDLPMAAITTAIVAASTTAPGRRDDVSRERSGYKASAFDGGSVSQSYLPTGAGTTSQNGVDAPSPTDTFVADKVAYWISNDVQNAQMKLDGIGDKPVEVSIRMQGNEAHIAFRTDELQAQAALENASVHLKDMLQREGLVLSGVSVGNSGTGGAGGAGDQQSGPRQGMRQQSVITSVPASTGVDRGSGVGRATGSALDLFV